GGETLLLLRQLSVELRERFVLALPVHLEDSAEPPQRHPASRQLPDAQQSDQVADAVAAVAVRVTRDLREQAAPVIVPQGGGRASPARSRLRSAVLSGAGECRIRSGGVPGLIARPVRDRR